MLRLGTENRRIMDARIKAQRSGLEAIHDELCKLSRANKERQAELLAQYPELLFLAVEG